MKAIISLIIVFIFQSAFGQIPQLNLSNKNEKKLEIKQVKVDVVVVGNISTTTFDILFHNPNSRDLEGELSMPLANGQEISRYALDIQGQLREGVIVEKVKARQAFEAVVRQKIDPGIVNLTKGNSFKTKIYPIPAKGNKRVVLAISETLKGDKSNLYYDLPMSNSQKIGKFELEVKVIKDKQELIKIQSEFENTEFDQQNDAYFLSFKRDNFKPTSDLKFTIPRFSAKAHQLFTCDFNGETYFYLITKAPELNRVKKQSANRITIYWDHSFSAEKRKLDKELALLDAYLTSLPGTKQLTFMAFNYKTSAPVEFEVQQNTSALLSHIRSLKNDGATALDNIRISPNSDEILCFSDAVNTIGESDLSTTRVPVYTITSATGSNYGLLKKVAAETNGGFIDLNTMTESQALDVMLYDQDQFISYEYNNMEMGEIYPNMPTRVGDYFEVSGILKKAKADLKINYGNQRGITASQTFKIDKTSDAPISRVWASKKIEYLMFDYSRNKENIINLSRLHNIVTRNSSFIVLDRVEDYVTHKIMPPVELQDEYLRILSRQEKDRGVDKELLYRNNLERINTLKRWYTPPLMVTRGTKRVRKDEVRPLQSNMVLSEVVVEENLEIDADRSETITRLSEVEVVEMEDEEVQEEVMAFCMVSNENKRKITSSKSNIKVLAWLPDAPYIDELKDLEGEDFDKSYYKLKQKNLNRPAYYIQVSDLLFGKGQHNKAIRILSNTVELDLENPELLKLVARRLSNEGEYTMAIKLFTEIKELRPEEPQSYRDLAIAYNKNKQYQEALGLYLEILDRQWERFENIKDIVFNELNCLIALHGNKLDLRDVHPEYIKSMPLDIRITLEWSSNDNDIDLWVIDPNGEKCYYKHRNTRIKGKMTKDFTRGYGPEEFSIKKAPKGIYTVYAKYYSDSRQSITGEVTLYLTLETKYGTILQTSKQSFLQLNDSKEVRQIGQIEF